MSEICPRCKREKVTREQRRADVAPPNGLCWASEHDARSNPHFVEQCERVAELAAAEERGRRAGIEEAAKRADQWYLHESHEPHSPGDSIRSLLTAKDRK